MSPKHIDTFYAIPQINPETRQSLQLGEDEVQYEIVLGAARDPNGFVVMGRQQMVIPVIYDECENGGNSSIAQCQKLCKDAHVSSVDRQVWVEGERTELRKGTEAINRPGDKSSLIQNEICDLVAENES